MKKNLLLILCTLCCCIAYAQRNCGFELNRAASIARDPQWEQKMNLRKASLQGIADKYKNPATLAAAKKTTTASPIPVIFHFMVTEAQLAQLGGVAGVAQRVDSQIAVLNRDFNRENPDSLLIPSGWKHLYANVGIRFGLAHTRPDGFGTPGYEIMILPDLPGGFAVGSNNCSAAKHAATGGIDAWDVTKYINVWCTSFTDFSTLLGLTTYKSQTPAPFPTNEEGFVMNYAAIGKRASASDYYIATGFGGDYYDLGRTLTHEMGHFFEIWHTWGDDGGLCPWNGGDDDGLNDTPPEGNYKYNNYPDTIPGGTYYDQCRIVGAVDTQAILYGVAVHDYMNYTDDISMFMFTHDQAAVMYSMVSDTGENHSLTQHPDLLQWSTKTAVPGISAAASLCLFPNPTSGKVFITFDHTSDQLLGISVTDVLGNEVQNIPVGAPQNDYSIELSGMSKGIYFVRCNFATGSITRKILLQ